MLPTMTTLFLIRHGLTSVTGSRLYGRTTGIHLDERGRQQAAALVERFEGLRLTAVYSSPLERCVETVEPLARAHRLSVHIADGLVEMDAGTWTGRTLASLRRTKRWHHVQRDPSGFRFPGGESFVEAEARLLEEVRRIVGRHPRGRVVVSTHGDLVRVLVSHFTGAHLDHFQRVIVDPGSVSVVHLGDSVPRVLLVNDTGSLLGFAPEQRRLEQRTPNGPGAPRGSGSGDGSRRQLRG